MDFVSTRNKVVKSLSTCKTTRKGDAPDDTTGAPQGVDTVLYSDKDILFGKVSNYKRKHPGNIVYRDKVMSVLEEFRLQTSAEEKLKILEVSLMTSGNKIIALCWKQRKECSIRSS
jgi:hypothetical protein